MMDRTKPVILIDYTNYAGLRKVREIAPQRIWFGKQDPWHPEEQYLLDAYDVQKDDMRTFAVVNIHRWGGRAVMREWTESIMKDEEPTWQGQ